MSAQVQPFVSPEQYLELERASEVRCEYYQGHVTAMAGGSFNHARVIGNLFARFHNVLSRKNPPCTVVSNDMRIRVSLHGLYTYPDIAVICGEPKFADSRDDTLENPLVLVEVLSPSTEARDRGFKAQQYRQVSSLKEYAFISQSEPRIEIFHRLDGGDWLLSESAGIDSICHFTSIACEVALADVYANISFTT